MRTTPVSSIWGKKRKVAMEEGAPIFHGRPRNHQNVSFNAN